MAHKYEQRVPPNAWVVVCDRTRARIFNTIWPHEDPWEEVADLVHPEGRLHERDTISDGPGSFSESGGRRQSGQAATDFRHRTAREFARQLVDCLEEHRLQGGFGALIVVAPALFLGVLRETLPAPLAKLVRCEMDKEYVTLNVRELQQRLGGHEAFEQPKLEP